MGGMVGGGLGVFIASFVRKMELVEEIEGEKKTRGKG